MKDKDNYNCWFLINQNVQEREFSETENKASATFLDFIKNKDYGEGIRTFRFDIYVEKSVNYGRHTDAIYLGGAHLSCHIEYDKFVQANEPTKHLYLLNATLTLLKYLDQRVALPKTFDSKSLIVDFTDYLRTNQLLLNENKSSQLIIKPFDTTRFRFLISTTFEVKERDIKYDLIDLQDFINNRLVGKSFGSSIREFDFGYEIYDYEGYLLPPKETANLRRYGTKYKNLLIVKQFDYRKLKDLAMADQFGFLRKKILESIQDIDKMNKKPKDFEKQKFYETIDHILTEYQKEIIKQE